MNDVVYTAQVRLTRHGGPDRTAWLPAGEVVRFGTHGPLAERIYGTPDPPDPVSTTLDYVVAAAGG